MRDLATSPTLAAASVGPLVGRVLASRYELLELLGEGGMGAVYRAHDRELDEAVALKLLRPEIAADAASLVRFRREVKLARRVTHRNVARTFDLGVDADLRFLTMELIVGKSITEHFGGERVALPEVLRVAEEVARGLAAAHAAGVVHRDLKPDNVMLADDRVVLTDFGIARIADGHREAAKTGSIIGTPAYMAPEQLDGGAVDGRTDIYALGTMLYELLLGVLPFSGDTPMAMAAQRLISEPPDPRRIDPNLPEPLSRLLQEALARKREARPDAQTFVDRIEHLRGRATLDRRSPRIPTLDLDALNVLAAPRSILVGDMTADPPHAGLARALTEALVDGLTQAKISRVLHAAPGTVKADLLLQSSLHVSGERARARARLVEGSGGESVWAAHVDGTLADGFDLEDRLTATVRDAVRARTSRESGPADPAVRAEYNKARAAFDRFALPFVQEAIGTLETLERASPGDPHVRGLLAVALVRAFGQQGGTDRSVLARAEELALRALETDPRLADARFAVAETRVYLGELVAGVRAIEETVRTSPSYAPGHATLGGFLCESGHLNEGVRRIELAIRLEPKNVIFQVERARVHALLGERARAEGILADVAARAGRASIIVGEMRLAIWWNDREMAARCAATIDEQPGMASWKRAAGLMWSVARGEPFPQAKEIFAVLTDGRSVPRHRARMQAIATEYYAWAGDTEAAFATLGPLADLPFTDLLWMDRCHVFDAMRSDPRFSEARAAVAARVAELWS